MALYFLPWLKWTLWGFIGFWIVISIAGAIWGKLFSEKKGRDWIPSLAGALAVLGVIGLVGFWLLAWVANHFVTAYEDMTGNTRELILLNDEREASLNGGWVLGTGGLSTGNSRFYAFYARGESVGVSGTLLGAEWEQLSVADTIIFEHPDGTRTVEDHGYRYICPPKLSWFLALFYWCRNFTGDDVAFVHTHWELHVPEGTIIRELNLDGQ